MVQMTFDSDKDNPPLTSEIVFVRIDNAANRYAYEMYCDQQDVRKINAVIYEEWLDGKR